MMNILGIDSSGLVASVALQSDDRIGWRVYHS